MSCKHWVELHNGSRKTLTAFFPDHPEEDKRIQIATTDSHDNYDDIKRALEEGSDDALDLFNPAAALDKEFSQVTDRVSVRNGRVYFDLVECNDVIADHMVRCLREEENFGPTPLAKFMERLAANPSEHSREHLFKWLRSENFTINSEGFIVGYKGVNVQAVDGEEKYLSTRSGPAVVNGKPMNGFVPNEPGSVIQMPRDQVTFDPNQTCSVGLHVGNWQYARDFGPATLEVEVDPADVVSVPVDAGGAKMRVWRYRVVKPVEAPYGTPIKPVEDYYDEYDDYYDEDDPDQEDGF